MTTQIGDPPQQTPLTIGDRNTVSPYWFNWLKQIAALLNVTIVKGYTGTITTAKLTGGGTNGSMTFKNGVLISQVPAT